MACKALVGRSKVYLTLITKSGQSCKSAGSKEKSLAVQREADVVMTAVFEGVQGR